MAYLFRPLVVKPVPKGATTGTAGGKRVARWTNRKGKAVVAELTADGTRCRVRSPTWWVGFRDERNKPDRARGFASREATLQLAARIEKGVAVRKQGGCAVDLPPDAPRLLADFLPAYAEHLAAKCQSARHRYEAVANVRDVITGAGLTTPAAVDCDRLMAWLLKEKRRVGKGADRKKAWSAQTLNHRVRKLRAFGNWLLKRKKAAANPFAGLELAGVEDDRRHVRRALDHPELLRLVAAARADPAPYAKMPGPDRAGLYLFAAYTGFRAGTLAALTPESVEWADGLPFRVFNRRQKNKKAHGVPFHPDVAAVLADWLRGRPAGRPLFEGWKGWQRYGARILRHDLGRARAAYLAEAAADPAEQARRAASDVLLYEDAAGEVFDFHSLRVQFVAGLAQAGVALFAACELAGHSDPKLTAKVYARWGKGGILAGEVAKLPGPGPGSVAAPAGLGCSAPP